MDQVIRNFKPKYFMATGSSHTTKGYLKLLQTVKSEGITAVEPTAKPRKIELGSVLLTVFPQPRYNDDEENNNSIGIRLEYGSFSVLMTGDSETDERDWWRAHNPNLIRDCTILKLAHHGSRNGTDQAWLDLVRPELAVASLGAGNDYGHPHAETISLLRKNEIPFLRTDLRGTITLVSNGRTWNLVNPELARRRRRAERRRRGDTFRRRGGTRAPVVVVPISQAVNVREEWAVRNVDLFLSSFDRPSPIGGCPL